MSLSHDVRIVIQILLSAFLAILFLQSGLDKVLDWAGNKSYITSYFERSPLWRFPRFLLFTITCMEVLSGILCAAGGLSILVGRSSGLAFLGALLSAATLLSLFFGQRLAKDYAGAAGMVPYFLTTIVAIAMLG